MSASPILGITEIAPAQVNTYAAINNILAMLEASENDIFSYNAAGGDFTATQDQFTQIGIFLVHDAAGDINFFVPNQVNGANSKRKFIIMNTGAHNVTVKGTPVVGLTYVIPTATTAVVVVSHTDVYGAVGSGGGGGGGGGGLTLPDVPWYASMYQTAALIDADWVWSYYFVESINMTSVEFANIRGGSFDHPSVNETLGLYHCHFGTNTRIGTITYSASTGLASASAWIGGTRNFIWGHELRLLTDLVAITHVGRVSLTIPGIRV